MPVLALAMLLAGGPASSGEPPVSPTTLPLDRLAGRYMAGKSGQMFDIARCGPDLCAIRIAPAGGCGDLAMRLAARTSPSGQVIVSGHFDRQPGAARHAVAGTLSQNPADDGRIVLRLHGGPGDTLRYLRRVFPYAETFARQGEGTCRPEDAIS
jgi:hypothetical protein